MAVERGPLGLIQFAREPVLGQVKTRLAADIGKDAALAVHCELVEWVCRSALAADLGPVELHVAGDCAAPLFQFCLGLGCAGIYPQRGDDLGERMFHALQDALSRYDRVLLIGSDCPGIDRAYLAKAAAALAQESVEQSVEQPVVVGPALDGGYVLIGASRVHRSLFDGVPWGSGEVLAATEHRLHALGWNFESLKPLADIDRSVDLPVWQALRGAWRPSAVPV